MHSAPLKPRNWRYLDNNIYLIICSFRSKMQNVHQAKELAEVSRGLKDELRLNQSMNDLHLLNEYIDKHNNITNYNDY